MGLLDPFRMRFRASYRGPPWPDAIRRVTSPTTAGAPTLDPRLSAARYATAKIQPETILRSGLRCLSCSYIHMWILKFNEFPTPVPVGYESAAPPIARSAHRVATRVVGPRAHGFRANKNRCKKNFAIGWSERGRSSTTHVSTSCPSTNRFPVSSGGTTYSSNHGDCRPRYV